MKEHYKSGRGPQLHSLLDEDIMDEDDEGLTNRIESRSGLHTFEHAEASGLGGRTYELANID